MSYVKRHSVLALVLALTVVSYVAGLVLLPRPRSARNDTTALLDRLRIDDVAAVELMNSAQLGATRLQRLDEGWGVEISGYLFPAAEARIDGFLSTLDELNIVRRVTSDEAALVDFELDTIEGQSGGQSLALFDTDNMPLAQLILGKIDAAGDVFVRFSDESSVYLVPNDVQFYIDQDDTYWSSLGLFPSDLSGSEVSSIRVVANNFQIRSDQPLLQADYTLVRQASLDESGWSVAGDSTIVLDSFNVDSLASALVAASGVAFAPDSSPSLNEPAARIDFTLDDGREWQLAIGDPAADDESRFFVRPFGDDLSGYDDGSSFSYYMSVWSLERMLQSLDALLPESELDSGPDSGFENNGFENGFDSSFGNSEDIDRAQ